MRTHYGPWQPCWISNQHQKHKSGRGPSSEHFWQVWLISVQRFQRRRFKCEKLTDGRRTLTHDKSSHGLWPGELKKDKNKCHSSPFINVVKGVFFVVRVTLVPVSYLSAPSAVHSYRLPNKFIRLVRIKQKFICIAYLYSKCTDCRIKHSILTSRYQSI